MYWILKAGWATCPNIKSIQHDRLDSKHIVETSGLIAHQNQLWLHNDSGDSARIFSYKHIDRSIQTHSIPSSKAKDWEDIAIDRNKKIVYIADTGDNLERRKDVSIVSYNIRTKHSDFAHISFETGPLDIEAIAWDPIQEHLVLMSKGRGGTVHTFIYSPHNPPILPLSSQYQFSISPANGLNPERITAMDISPDGKYIAVRSYIKLFLWQRSAEQSIPQALTFEPCIYPIPAQKQGESIGFQDDGRSLWTISEGKNQPIIELRLLRE